MLLTREKGVERIDIEMNVGMADVIEKATYQKIKDYVKEKRKHGSPMHEASNKVDVPKREYSVCLYEKEKATVELTSQHIRMSCLLVFLFR